MLELLQCKEELKWKECLTVNIIIMKKITIKQVRSRIGRPIDQKRTLDALGLKKINSTVEHNSSPQILGMVKKVSHLIKVL